MSEIEKPQPEGTGEFVAPSASEEQRAEKESAPSIESLPASLGFTETPEMIEVKQPLVEAIKSGNSEKTTELINAWRDLAEKQADEIKEPQEYTQAQIGLLVAQALIFKESGDTNTYVEHLEDVFSYADNIGQIEITEMTELANQLRAELKSLGVEAQEAFERLDALLVSRGFSTMVKKGPSS